MAAEDSLSCGESCLLVYLRKFQILLNETAGRKQSSCSLRGAAGNDERIFILMADVDLKELLEAGAHFGHQTRRWNPKMRQYIYGVRGGVHIIDLTKTGELLKEATSFARETAARGGKVLLVGTKRQAAPVIKEEAEAAGLPYVTERWLGGMLTNFRTIRLQVNRLKKLEAGLESGDFVSKYNKKEVLDLSNEAAALNRVFAGIKNMDGLPGAVFVVDVPRELIAVAEARKLNIPVIGIADTNADPDLINYPIPANDDAIRTVRIIARAIAQAAAEGAKMYESRTREASTEEAK
jgi:small subunit ribosomal protein S2